ncbi:MAG: two-component system response regulator CreB [Rhodoferax sp.]|nr:MAG: two-component system response regulator CreB [Rhodoferax sp.]
MATRILLVEDDPAIARTVAYVLEREGWQVVHCLRLQEAHAQLQHDTLDALVLDLGLPDGNGLELLRTLRAQANPLPVLVLSAQGEELDRVLGLELGADDYLAKPFSPRELAARVKALLRRSSGAMAGHARAKDSAVLAEVDGQRILLRGQPLDITRREYRLLSCLLQGNGRIYSREQLLEMAWGDDSDSIDRTVDTHVKTLRAKLRAIDPLHDYIETHRGMGYSLKLPAGN